MVNKNYFKIEKNRNLMYWFLGIVVFFMLAYPGATVPLATESVFDFLGITFAASTIFFFIGLFLLIMPGAQLVGIIMVGVSILVGGASVYGALFTILDKIGIGTTGLYILGGIVVLVVLNALGKRKFVPMQRRMPRRPSY